MRSFNVSLTHLASTFFAFPFTTCVIGFLAALRPDSHASTVNPSSSLNPSPLGPSSPAIRSVKVGCGSPGLLSFLKATAAGSSEVLTHSSNPGASTSLTRIFPLPGAYSTSTRSENLTPATCSFIERGGASQSSISFRILRSSLPSFSVPSTIDFQSDSNITFSRRRANAPSAPRFFNCSARFVITSISLASFSRFIA